MIKTTLSAGKQAVRRQASVDQAWRRGTASAGFGKMRTWTHLGRNGSIRRSAGPRGQRDRCVPITFPVPFDATAADIQKRDNTPRHAVIWLVHVVVSPPRPSRQTHAGELSGNHRITSYASAFENDLARRLIGDFWVAIRRALPVDLVDSYRSVLNFFIMPHPGRISFGGRPIPTLREVRIVQPLDNRHKPKPVIKKKQSVFLSYVVLTPILQKLCALTLRNKG
jgi:hypothetical protein